MPSVLRILSLKAHKLGYGPRLAFETFLRKNSKHWQTLPKCSLSSGGVADPENKGKPQRGVNFDTLGSWNNRMELALNLEQSIKTGKIIPDITVDKCASATLLGRRNANEDRVIVSELQKNLLLFGIFDGHGGDLAVNYVVEHIQPHIQHWLDKGEHDLKKILYNSFVEINNAFSRFLFYNYAGDDQAMSSGTTATVALLRNSEELVIGHVGDSSAIVCRDGQALRLSPKHEPDVDEEKARIKRSGGTIIFNSVGKPRVNGRLDMTRSIGDVEMKPFGVIAEPHIRSIGVKHGHDAFLLLTTDGVSFVMADQEVVDIASTCEEPQASANIVVDQSLQYGSEDNCTAVIVPFGAWGKYASSPNAVPYSFGRNMIGNRYR